MSDKLSPEALGVLSAVARSTEPPEPKPIGIAMLVRYAAGVLSEKAAGEVEAQAVERDEVREKLVRTCRAVDYFRALPVHQLTASDAFEAEVLAEWRKFIPRSSSVQELAQAVLSAVADYARQVFPPRQTLRPVLRSAANAIRVTGDIAVAVDCEWQESGLVCRASDADLVEGRTAVLGISLGEDFFEVATGTFTKGVWSSTVDATVIEVLGGADLVLVFRESAGQEGPILLAFVDDEPVTLTKVISSFKIEDGALKVQVQEAYRGKGYSLESSWLVGPGLWQVWDVQAVSDGEMTLETGAEVLKLNLRRA